jgi:hypothetical protein
MKAALLSIVMLSGILVWGAGIYSADASTKHAVIDGYGVGAAHR